MIFKSLAGIKITIKIVPISHSVAGDSVTQVSPQRRPFLASLPDVLPTPTFAGLSQRFQTPAQGPFAAFRDPQFNHKEPPVSGLSETTRACGHYFNLFRLPLNNLYRPSQKHMEVSFYRARCVWQIIHCFYVVLHACIHVLICIINKLN